MTTRMLPLAISKTKTFNLAENTDNSPSSLKHHLFPFLSPQRRCLEWHSWLELQVSQGTIRYLLHSHYRLARSPSGLLLCITKLRTYWCLCKWSGHDKEDPIEPRGMGQWSVNQVPRMYSITCHSFWFQATIQFHGKEQVTEFGLIICHNGPVFIFRKG